MQIYGNSSLQYLLKYKYSLAALPLVLVPSLLHGQAQPGPIDTSFGNRGIVTTDFTGSGDSAAAIAIQPDGKIVVAGTTAVGHAPDFALARYSPDGTLDTSFGAGGRATTAFGGNGEHATSVAIEADGKIVVAGASVVGYFNNFATARYNPNGTLDAAFGIGGKVLTDFGVSAEAESVAVQPDGKIVAGGHANIDGNEEFEIVRYNPDGTLDNSFGTNGKVNTEFGLLDQGFSRALAYSLAILPDAKIVLAGEAFVGDGSDFALARYNSNGTLDASFGNGGKVITNVGGTRDAAFSLAIQPDGKIVLAGIANIVGGYGFALARYERDGMLDHGFGTGGEVTTDFGLLDQGFSNAQANSLGVRPDGKLVVGGRAYLKGDFRAALAQFNSSGTLDSSFGTAGKLTPIFGSRDSLSSIAIQRDGKVVVAGGVTVSESSDFLLARYN